MINMLKKVGFGFALGAVVLGATAQPADAQRWRGYHGYHGYRHGDAGTAVVAGIAGLAIGAAIASSDRGRYAYYDRYYDRRYDGDWRYYRDRGYYPPNGYYWNRYAARGWRGCDVRRVWDPYMGRHVRVRYCR